MSTSTVQFRFLSAVETNATDSAKNDHTVSIYRNKDESGPRFLWVFNDGGANTRQVTFMKDEDTVIEAVRNMFHLLSWDTEPYARVQVFAPGFPSPLLRMSDIDRFGPDIRAVLRSVFASWPEDMASKDANELVRIFRVEGMEGDDEDDEDDETAEYEADDDEESSDDEESEEDSPCANCPCTPQRPARERQCPGAPARAAWREFLEDPECPGTSSYNLRVRRTVTETPAGPRVHMTFE